MSRVPLAWSNLSHKPARLVLAAAGVGFAVFLMFVQVGFQNALFDSTVALLRRLDGDVLLVHRARESLSLELRIPVERLIDARNVPGVVSASPLHTETTLAEWTDLSTDARPNVKTVRAIAVDEEGAPLRDPDVRRLAPLLRGGDVLFDARSRPVYGPTAVGTVAELAGRPARVAGHFRLGSDFTAEGNLVLSAEQFAERFRPPWGGDPLAEMDLGVLTLQPGADPAAVCAALDARLPADCAALPVEGLAAREVRFWQSATPIGFAFGFGVAMGFVVGVVICFQILASDVAEHLPEYATLKAMGYPNRYLAGVVLQEALILAGLGFVPGLAIAAGFYALMAGLTGLPMALTLGRVALVLVLTLVMCAASGLLALKKVAQADPAEVF